MQSPEDKIPVPPQKQRPRLPLWSFLLAIVLICAALYTIPHLILRKPTDYSVRLGNNFTHRSRPFASLPNGIKYCMNNNSEISHQGGPFTSVHELNLDGEGYFIVPKGILPLLIHTPAMDVRTDSGTLNINDYKGDQLIETSIFDGTAEVTLHTNPEKKFRLLAGDKLIIRTDGQAQPAIRLDKVHYRPEDSLYIESAWTKFRIAGSEMTMEELLPRLRHEFDAKIFVTGGKLKSKRVTFMVEELDLPLTLAMLQPILDFHFTANGNEVHIEP